MYNRIDVSIHDIDVSITDVHVSTIDIDVSIADVHVSIVDVDVSILDSYVSISDRYISISSIDVAAIYAFTSVYVSIFGHYKPLGAGPCSCMHGTSTRYAVLVIRRWKQTLARVKLH